MGRCSGKAACKVANESAVNLIAEQLKSIKKIDSDARKTAEKKKNIQAGGSPL